MMDAIEHGARMGASGTSARHGERVAGSRPGPFQSSFQRSLPPRTRDALQRIAVRTRTVHVMKLVLPAAAILLIAAVVLWPYLVPDQTGFPVAFADLEDSVDSVSMIDARFVGTDDHNLPFTVSARRIDNLKPDATEMVLHQPAADMTLDDGSWILVRSDSGEYAVKAESLDLVGDVELFHDSGYEFRTSRASVDLEKRIVSGTEPVAGHGPLGELNATGFRVLDNGGTIVFDGPARLVIHPSAMKPRPQS